MATASPEDGDTAWTTSSAVYLPNPAFLRTTQANHQSNGLPPHDSWTERHRRLPSPTRDTTQYEPSPSAAASVSPALVSELARSGFGMFGLLHSWKITSLEALGALGDRHFKEFSDAAQAAEIAPDAISELRALRRRLALQAMAAVDAAFTSEGGDAEERNLLTICAQVCRKLAAVTLDRDNAAKERLSAARTQLHEFTSSNMEDPVAGAQAVAGAYDEIRAALQWCSQEEEQFLRDAAVPTLSAVVLSCLCMCRTGHRDREAFAQALQVAFRRRVLGEMLESQLHSAYHNLMEDVPGAFDSPNKIRTRRATKRAKLTEVDARPVGKTIQIPVDLFVPISEDEFISKKYDQSSTASFFSKPYNKSRAQFGNKSRARGSSASAQFGKFFNVDRWYFGQPKTLHRELSTGDMWYTIQVASD